jgi:DNA recombination protein RmuC
MNIGNHIKKTQESYDAALGQLKSGNGNLIGQAQKLKDLGVKSKKSLPTDLVNDAISNETS